MARDNPKGFYSHQEATGNFMGPYIVSTPALLIRVSAVPKCNFVFAYKLNTDFSSEISVATHSMLTAGASFRMAPLVRSSPAIDRPANTKPFTPALAWANAIALVKSMRPYIHC